MEIALAQINSTLGDFSGNSQNILDKTLEAHKAGADLVVFPELCLLGYAPNDLLERPELVKEHDKHLNLIAKKLPKNICVLVGCLNSCGNNLYNSAALIKKNKIQKYFHKSLLPNYDVFDEHRHFTSGKMTDSFFNLKGKKILVTICEDLWFSQKPNYEFNPLDKIKKKPDHIISLNASPFEVGKQKLREEIATNISKKFSCPLTYVNMCGAQDELIFDGQSFSTDKNGIVTTRLKAFEEQVSLCTTKKKTSLPSKFEALEKALILGVSDYFKKTGFKKAHLGLSGGIDSALVVYLATKALGSDAVTAIALPGPYNKKLSLSLAKKLSKNLKIRFIEHDINKLYTGLIKSFDQSFGASEFGLMHENTQARLRGLSLMAFSNKENSLLLATSNKSELTVGYSTLYGDQCGALMPIGDLLKTDVVKLCEWINKKSIKEFGHEVIPHKIISRPPSAELRPDQKDSDSLPSYEKLDQSINRMITLRKEPGSDLDKWVLNRSYRSEFKRWQAAPILKISAHAFGIGRRMPLAHKFSN